MAEPGEGGGQDGVRDGDAGEEKGAMEHRAREEEDAQGGVRNHEGGAVQGEGGTKDHGGAEDGGRDGVKEGEPVVQESPETSRNWKPIIVAAAAVGVGAAGFAYVVYKQRALENTLENLQRAVQPSGWPWPIRLWW